MHSMVAGVGNNRSELAVVCRMIQDGAAGDRALNSRDALLTGGCGQPLHQADIQLRFHRSL